MQRIMALGLITIRSALFILQIRCILMLKYVFKAKAEYAPYYRNSLLYLACVDVEKDMSPEERLIRAHDLSISAFLGDTIYNFGELVSGAYDQVQPEANIGKS
jgi:hypothetical protein